MPDPKTLYFLRHAKSSWEDPGLDDHDRPLAPRGRKAAEVIGAHLRVQRIQPELVLVSSSRRTRETLDGVAPAGDALIEPELYGAGPREILARLQRLPDGTGSVMVIGHNPAMQTIVLRLAGGAGRSPEGTALADVERKFPTGALATLTFRGAWRDLEPGAAELVAFVRPKALRNSAAG
jgi:phosphohistidine phosphatase